MWGGTMKRLLFGIIASCLACVGFAIDGNVICTKAINIHDQWNGILPGCSPVIPGCEQVVREELFTVNVLFVSPSIKHGRICVSGKLRLTDSSGKEKFSIPLEKQAFACENPDSVFLFPNFLLASFDPPDALGEYTFSAVLKDENSGKTKTVSSVVKLVDKCAYKVDDDPMKAMNTFYSQPASQNIIPAFQDLLKKLPDVRQKQGNAFNPVSMLGLFYYALKNNPQLWKEFARYANALDNDESRCYAAAIMHELGDNAFAMLSEQTRKAWNPKMAGMFNIGNDIIAPWQLDLLWSEFFVTGRREPVMRIANEIAKMKGNISLEDFKKIQNPTDNDRKSMMTYLVGMAANWSLNSNAGQHMLVAEYIECALERNEFRDDFVKASVNRILANLNKAAETPAPEKR